MSFFFLNQSVMDRNLKERKRYCDLVTRPLTFSDIGSVDKHASISCSTSKKHPSLHRWVSQKKMDVCLILFLSNTPGHGASLMHNKISLPRRPSSSFPLKFISFQKPALPSSLSSPVWSCFSLNTSGQTYNVLCSHLYRTHFNPQQGYEADASIISM